MSQPAAHSEPSHHHLDDGAPPRHGPTIRQSILVPTMFGLAIGAIFVAVFLAAFHAPRPHDLPVAFVGSSSELASAQGVVDKAAPGAIHLKAYSSEKGAVSALEHRSAYGAFVSSASGQSTLHYAGANGPAVTSTLEGVFAAVAASSQTTLKSDDTVPTSSGDTRSLSIFYAGFGLVLAGFLFGLISFQMTPRLQLRWRLVSLGAFSVLSGVVVAIVAGSAGFNALPGNVGAITAVTVLLAMAVGAATLLMMRVGGPIGTLLASLVLLILGNATGGGTLPPDFLPGWLRPLSDILPAGLGLRALQGESYFHNDGYARGVLLLGAWTVICLAIVYVIDVTADRRAAKANVGSHAAALA